MIRKEAWPFYRTISGVRLCWELEEPKEPGGWTHGFQNRPFSSLEWNASREIGILLPNKQHQHRTFRRMCCPTHCVQKDVLPCALCWLLCPVSAALASILRMDSISTSYNGESDFQGGVLHHTCTPQGRCDLQRRRL